jgi:hypothetical protein
MNRIQFFVLVGLSSLVMLLLIGHIFLVRKNNFEQNRLAQAQQIVNQAQSFQSNLRQLAVRIYQDSQKTGDQGLKDILDREKIKYNPAPATTTPPPEMPVPPAPSPTPTH